jgi:hypothetical protein
MYEHPALPLDREWTDQEVYQQLNLSDKEIELIETLIK